jgi:hypothetical protein
MESASCCSLAVYKLCVRWKYLYAGNRHAPRHFVYPLWMYNAKTLEAKHTQSVNYFNYFVVMSLNTRDSWRSPIQRLISNLSIQFMPGCLNKRSRTEGRNITIWVARSEIMWRQIRVYIFANWSEKLWYHLFRTQAGNNMLAVWKHYNTTYFTVHDNNILYDVKKIYARRVNLCEDKCLQHNLFRFRAND